MDKLRRWSPARVAFFVAMALLALPALWQLVNLWRASAERLAFPMDLEWLEGASLYQAHRLLHGDGVYLPPQSGYCALPYPPFYFAVVAGLGKLFGLDYWTGRAVSLAAAGGGMLLSAAVVFRHVTPRRLALPLALLTVGAIAAANGKVEGWYDLARIDLLAIALPVAAAALLSVPRLSAARLVTVALLLTAAIYTKQTMAAPVAALLGISILRRRRDGWKLAGAVALLAGGTYVGLQLATDGWFRFWNFLFARHSLRPGALAGGTLEMLRFAPYLAIAPLLAALALRRRTLTWTTAQWVALLVATVPASLLPYAKAGGSLNNFVPLLFVAPTALMLLAWDALKPRVEPAAPRALLAPLALAVLASLYVGMRVYSPLRLMPGDANWRAAVAFDDYLEGLPGSVLIANHPFLAARHGKGLQLNPIGYADLAMGGGTGGDARRDIARIAPRWVIFDNYDMGLNRGVLPGGYELQGDVTLRPWTIALVSVGPRFVFEREVEAHAAR